MLLCFPNFPPIMPVICIMPLKKSSACYIYADKAKSCYFMLAKKEPNHAERIVSIMDIRLMLACAFSCPYHRRSRLFHCVKAAESW